MVRIILILQEEVDCANAARAEAESKVRLISNSNTMKQSTYGKLKDKPNARAVTRARIRAKNAERGTSCLMLLTLNHAGDMARQCFN